MDTDVVLDTDAVLRVDEHADIVTDEVQSLLTQLGF